jgi:hypothetical protein
VYVLGVFILIGIITGFIIGTYYLLQYWGNPLRDLDEIINLDDERDKASKIISEINKKNYESAYLKNTKFTEDLKGLDISPLKEHIVHAFHPVSTPENKKNINLIIRREGYKGEEEPEKKIEDIKKNNLEKNQDKQLKEYDILNTGKDEGEINEDNLKGELAFLNNKEEKGGLEEMPEIQQVNGIEFIKTPVVIGENVIQRMQVNDLPLDMTAIKIRDIDARITELVTDVITDKVIIQGVVHKQIFYVGEDNVVHHQAEDIEFSYFVDIPGAEPGMDVLIEPTIEHIAFDLILDGNVVHQKVVLQFFVKVLSMRQLIVETGEGPLVKIERVIGENSIQSMVMNEVNLALVATKIVDVTAEVVDLVTDVIADKVIIQGIIHKQLFYIGEDEVEHHQAEDIPFSEFVDIPGAEPGMNVQVHPSIEHIKQELSEDGTIVTQEIVLELFVKVTETVQINIVTGEDSLVMLPEVIRENTKQILSQTDIVLDQIAIKIKEINATVVNISGIVIENKVIIQGTIHKQIFYVGEDNIEYHQNEDVPFSTFVDTLGAREGMNVDINAEVAHVKPELSPVGDLLTQKVIIDLFVKVTENIQFNVNEVGPYGV